MKDRVHDEAEIAARLATMPGWSYADGAIHRTYRTANWKATLLVVSTIGALCEMAWHHPDLAVSYDMIVVTLSTHSAKGVTDKDFALAAKIESIVGWRPADEGAPFTGPPKAHAVVVHDQSSHE